MLHHIQLWIEQLYGGLGYGSIFFLMTLESSLFPVPAELVMIPAGYLSHEGHLNFLGALIAGAAGSLLGAFLNYLIGSTLGRAILLRYGRYLLIDAARYRQAELLFLQNAAAATFFGRLFPVIRHLISLPAGVFRMKPSSFALWTFSGASVLCGLELTVGFYLGPPAVSMVEQYSHISVLVVLVAAALATIWYFRRRSG